MLVKLLAIPALFTASVLAVPALAIPAKRSEATQIAKVLYQANLHGDVSIQVTSQDGAFLGESCSATLNSGAFADTPITFNVNERGHGYVTVGTTQYLTHSNITLSGGIICIQMYNDQEHTTSCDVPLPSGLVPALVTRGAANCIPGGMTSLGHIQLLLARRSASDAVPVSVEESNPLAIRDNAVRNDNKTLDARLLCTRTLWTEKIGDGNPHQNYLQTQITDALNCGNSLFCTVSHEVAFTKSVKWQVGFGAAISKWIDGGYSVQEWWSTTTTDTCFGQAGQYVGMWHSTAHTAYTVKNLWKFGGDCNICECGEGESEPRVLFSPNQHNKGGSPWCMVGPQSAFKYKGYEWMDTQGPDVRPGGP